MKAIILLIMLLMGAPTQVVVAQNQAVRCAATTQKGERCKNNAINKTKYCRVHQSKTGKSTQCKAKTQDGTRCKRAAKTAGYCTQHYKMQRSGKK